MAAGRYDGYWERGLKIWDIAGGVLLVREAGGLVEPIRAEQDLLNDGHVVAASGAVFEKFSNIIRKRPE